MLILILHDGKGGHPYHRIGKKISIIRVARSISQKELGAKINTDAYYISKIERASIGISLDRLFDFAKALKVDPQDLLNFADLDRYNQD